MESSGQASSWVMGSSAANDNLNHLVDLVTHYSPLLFLIRVTCIIENDICSWLCLKGQAIFASGGLLDSFTIMQIGRFVFGIGGESLAVAQNTYAVSWFKGKELNMVFGFQVKCLHNFPQV